MAAQSAPADPVFMDISSLKPVDHPPVSVGTSIQITTCWEDFDYKPAKVLNHFGGGVLSVEVQDHLSGALIQRDNVRYIDDPFAKSQQYIQHVLGEQDGGIWKATEDQSHILERMKALEARMDVLEKKCIPPKSKIPD